MRYLLTLCEITDETVPAASIEFAAARSGGELYPPDDDPVQFGCLAGVVLDPADHLGVGVTSDQLARLLSAIPTNA